MAHARFLDDLPEKKSLPKICSNYAFCLFECEGNGECFSELTLHSFHDKMHEELKHIDLDELKEGAKNEECKKEDE